MAFNPDPKVSEARSLAAKYSKTRVIVIMVDDDAGTIEYASYGKTKKLCDDTKRLADAAYETILSRWEGT